MSGQAEVWPRPVGCVRSRGPWQLPFPSEEALELGQGGGLGALPLCHPRRGVSMAGGRRQLPVRASGCTACPPGGICRLLRGLWGRHLARPVRRLRGALPGSAFGTLQWIKPSFIPAPGCPLCSLKPPQGHLCRPVPFHSAEHEQVLCLDRLLRPCVLMEALCPPGTLAERVLPPVPGKVQSLPLCRLLPHSGVTTVWFQDVC